MEPGDTFQITSPIKKILIIILKWLKTKGNQGGTVQELDTYEKSIKWSGDHLARYLVMPQCRSWIGHNETTDSYFINQDGKSYLAKLKEEAQQSS